MKNFVKIKDEIEKIIADFSDRELKHARGTLDWLLKIRPDADEVMQIAAFAHDIERCFRDPDSVNQKLITEQFDEYLEYKNLHSENGAEKVAEIFKKYGEEKGDVERVKFLITNHENGQGEARDVCDADSLSYLTDNFVGYLRMKGAARTRVKLDWMYNRMSEKGKKIGLNFYNQALQQLNQ